MRLSNEAVTSCKAMAMLVLCGAIVLATAARCRDMLQLPCSQKASALGGVHFSPYACKHLDEEFLGVSHTVRTLQVPATSCYS